MKLQELRKIAEARTKGEWEIQSIDDHRFDIYPNPKLWRIVPSKLLDKDYLPTAIECASACKQNIQFIATIANHIDALLDVVEAADAFMIQYCEVFQLPEAHQGKYITRFKEALKKLEQI